MKKLLSIVLATAMVFSLSVMAFADELNTGKTSGEAIVKTSTLKEDGHTSAENYTVTYPAETTIAWEKESTDIQYTVQAQLTWDHQLKLDVASADNKMSSDNQDDYTLDYTLTGDTSIQDGPVIAEGTTKTLNIGIPAENWAKVPVDEYKDTLTFTSQLVSA